MNSVGKPWTTQEDLQLIKECSENISIQEISVLHQRNIGGIKSRIRKNTFGIYPELTNLEISELVGIPVSYLEQCKRDKDKQPPKQDVLEEILKQLKIVSEKLDSLKK